MQVHISADAVQEKGFNFNDARLMRGAWRNEPNSDLCKVLTILNQIKIMCMVRLESGPVNNHAFLFFYSKLCTFKLTVGTPSSS